MKFFEIIRTANHNLFRNKVRTGLTMLAIFVGSFTIILNVAINAGVNGFIDEQLNIVGGEDYIIITKGVSMHDAAMSMYGSANIEGADVEEYREEQNFDYMTPKDLEEIKKVEGIKPESVSERNTGVKLEYIRKNETGAKRFVAGYVGAMLPGNIRVPVTAGEIAKSNATENIITLMPKYAQALGYKNDADIIGEIVILGARDPMTQEFYEYEAKVVGVEASGVIAANGHLLNQSLVDKISYDINDKYITEVGRDVIGAAQASFDTERFSEAEIKANLEKAGYSGMVTSDFVGEIKSFFDVILVVFSIFGGIALLAAAIGIVNTLYMSVEERTREIGLDKALGMSSGRVFAEFAAEAILLGFWGSIVGVGIAMLLGNGVNQIVHAPGGFLEVFPTFELFKFTFGNIIPIVIVVMMIAFIAGTLPAIKAARKNPIDALRYE